MRSYYKSFFAAIFLILASPAVHATVWTIQVMDFQFVGTPFVVQVGDTMRWEWVNGTHTTTAVGYPAGATPWNSPITAANPVFEYVVTAPGGYAYVCSPHASIMQATFFAEAAGGPCDFVPEITPANLILCPGTTDTLFASPSDDGAYQWFMAGNAIAGATNQFLVVETENALLPFAVEVTVDGCTDTSEAVTYDAHNFQLPFVIHGGDEGTMGPNGEVVICTGDTFTLTTNYTANVQWENAAGPIAGANDSILFITESGVYTVSGAPSVCPNYIQPLGLNVVVIVNEPVTPVITQSNDSLFASPMSADYQWFLNGSAVPGATNANYVPMVSGNYTVVTTDFNMCGAESTPIAVTVGGGGCPFTAMAMPDDLALCPQGTDTLFAAPAGGTYQWFKEGNAITGATNAFYEVSFVDDVNFNFSVAVTLDGCTDTSAQVLIEGLDFSPPVVSQSANGWMDSMGTNICAGDTLTLELQSPYTQNIQWFNAGTPIDDANGNVFYATSSGSYTVTAATAACPDFFQTVTVPVVVNVNIPVVPVISQSNDTLYVDPQTGVYTWFLNGAVVPGQSGAFLVPTNAGLYNVMMEDVSQCSGISAPFAFGLVDTCAWEPTIAPTALTLCPNTSDTLFATPLGGGYQWYQNGVPVLGAFGDFIVVSAATGVGSQFSVVVANEGCIDTSSSALIDAYEFEDLAVTNNNAGWTDADGTVHLCSGDVLVLTLGSPFDSNIQWMVGGAPVSGANQTTLNVTQGGSYTVSAAPAQCPNYNQVLGVAINAVTHVTDTPQVTLVNDTLFATGSGAASGYQWYMDGSPIAGAMNAFFVPTASGDYSVSWTDANQCDATSNTVVFTGMETISFGKAVRIYPNPVHDVLFIDVPNAHELEFCIIDALGRVVMEGASAERLAVNNLANGVYTVTLYGALAQAAGHAVFVKH
ncbi:MAG TPA: T9SS type A sorting domain-containing protein [Chitinophagales bacterium]|nr:T9SS type A sorting domain-containing protein [Chitinophagales bacterium]